MVKLIFFYNKNSELTPSCLKQIDQRVALKQFKNQFFI